MANPFAAIAGRALRTADGKSDSRRKLIQAARAAARRLGLDDDDRRALQVEVVGKRSLGDMTLAELGKLLDRLNRDWKGPSGDRAHTSKIRALWWTLYWLGAVDEPKDRAIDGFVRRQTSVSALRFLDSRQAHSVIDALKSWAGREGVAWPRMPAELTERLAVLDAIWSKLRDAGEVAELGYAGYVVAALGIQPPEQSAWSKHELDAAIRLLGKKLRRAKGRP